MIIGTDEIIGYCDCCGSTEKFYRSGVSHWVHIIMCFLTMGLSLIIWLLYSVRIGGWRCQRCGSRM